METKTITLDEFVDALDKNGFQHIRGTFITFSGDRVYGGCAIGQAAVNLGVDAGDLADKLDDIVIKKDSLSGIIFHWNDKTQPFMKDDKIIVRYLSYREIAARVKARVRKEQRGITIEVATRSYKV